jgi:hypothetical protein
MLPSARDKGTKEGQEEQDAVSDQIGCLIYHFFWEALAIAVH